MTDVTVLTLAGTTALLNDIDDRVNTLETTVPNKVTGNGITDIVKLTAAEYDALGSPDASTLYVIVG